MCPGLYILVCSQYWYLYSPAVGNKLLTLGAKVDWQAYMFIVDVHVAEIQV